MKLRQSCHPKWTWDSPAAQNKLETMKPRRDGQFGLNPPNDEPDRSPLHTYKQDPETQQPIT